MAITQQALTVFTGDGPTAFTLQVLQDGAAMNLSGVTAVVVTLKGGNDQPDPLSSSPNYFSSAGSGLVITSAGSGLCTWTVPAASTAVPGVFWFHAFVIAAGVQSTFGFGTLTVLAV